MPLVFLCITLKIPLSQYGGVLRDTSMHASPHSAVIPSHHSLKARKQCL